VYGHIPNMEMRWRAPKVYRAMVPRLGGIALGYPEALTLEEIATYSRYVLSTLQVERRVVCGEQQTVKAVVSRTSLRTIICSDWSLG